MSPNWVFSSDPPASSKSEPAIESLWKQAGEIGKTRFDDASRLLQQAAQLSREGKNLRSEALSLTALGELHRRYGRSAPERWEAMHLFVKSSELLARLPDSLELARNDLRMGGLLKEFGNQEEAVRTLLKAVAALSILNANADEAAAYFELADFFRKTGNPDLALNYGLQAIEAARKGDSTSMTPFILNLIGEIFLDQQKWEPALAYLQEALAAKPGSAAVHRVSILNNLGRGYLGMGQIKESQAHFLEALLAAREIDEPRSATEALSGLARIYILRGLWSEAMSSMEEALRLAERTACGECQEAALRQLGEAYRAMGNPEAALRVFDQLQQLTDSLITSRRFQEMYLVEAMYKGRAMEEKNLLLLAQKEADRARQQALLLVGVLLLVIALFFFVQNRSKKRANYRLNLLVEKRTDQLRKAYAEVIDLNRELDIFAYRTAHDIRGPVARLLGLSELVLAVDIKNEQVARYMRLIYTEARNMDFMLFRFMEVNHIKHLTEPVVVVQLREFAWKVFDSIKERKLAGAGEVTFLTDVPSDAPLSTRPGLLEIALRNLFENSITYRNKEAPRIRLLGGRGPEGWKISVWDNGQGISAEAEERIFQMFFRGTHVSKGLGLGLYTARMAVEKLGGTLNLKSSEQGNTEFEIFLPNLRP